ncbi:PLC-like phosphodiesterase [Podospora didyma]|uniref:Phosphoinositide phospholipase C n=1 Tax=Podospora didyma TaxID=330526 RepID=A0AAE0N8N8_9PEZI|nr:PLC-like phosphodiesterase [Podospora didyma]
MASAGIPPTRDAPHQAGGGLSGEAREVKIKTLGASLISHLHKIYDSQLSHADAAAFLRNVQRDSEADIAHQLAANPKHPWDFSAFLHYITSTATNVVAPPQQQDNSWPLSSYFISSSHNTYLTGNQLSSTSSADAYKNVLLRGCRCIEVDVWDGDESDLDTSDSSSDEDEPAEKAKPKTYEKRKTRVEKVKEKVPASLLEKLSLGKTLDKYVEKKKPEPEAAAAAAATVTTKAPSPSAAKPAVAPAPVPAPAEGSAPSPPKKTRTFVEPLVFHGYTLTKEISFRDVCVAVRDYGFVASDLPLIVSLEVHCSTEQQEAMVQIMEEEWAGLLLPVPNEDVQALPAPGDLRGKILVKVKYAPPDKSEGSPPKAPSKSASEESVATDAAAAAAAAAAGTAQTPPPKKPSKIIQALSKLGIYTRGVSFKSLTQPEAAMPTHIFSLSENGVMEVHEKSARELFDHNRHFLMRAYPSGLRIRSSNLDPAVFWRKGIQIVALNWQNWDEGMMLNEGMFAGTGGYVLKPNGYRTEQKLIPPAKVHHTLATQATAVRHYAMDLTIEVLGAQSLPLPPGDRNPDSFRPYLKVEVHVEEPGERHGSDPVPVDGKEKEGEFKAKTKAFKGRDPDFRGQVLKFHHIPGVVPELSFVRFLVRDDELGHDSLAGWACVRLDRLREGYRFVHLLDVNGMETGAIVFIKVAKKLI